MKHIHFGALLCVGVGLSGCSIYPLPEDVSHADTYAIVRNIRCETRNAIRSYAQGLIETYSGIVQDGLTGKQLVDAIDRRDFAFEKLNLDKLPEPLRGSIGYYRGTTISYEFTLQMTEVNNNGAALTILRSFSKRTNNIGLGASDNLIRKNTRNFRIYDTFDNLATKVTDAYCGGRNVGENFQYPIAGTIGIGKFVGAFLDLSQSGNLGGKDNPSIPTLSDTIIFTTKLSGNVDPSFTLKPLSDSFALTNAAFNFDNSREDAHQVTVTMSLPSPVAKSDAKKKGPGVAAAAAANDKEAARQELSRQRDILFQNAVIQISNSLSASSPF